MALQSAHHGVCRAPAAASWCTTAAAGRLPARRSQQQQKWLPGACEASYCPIVCRAPADLCDCHLQVLDANLPGVASSSSKASPAACEASSRPGCLQVLDAYLPGAVSRSKASPGAGGASSRPRAPADLCDCHLQVLDAYLPGTASSGSLTGAQLNFSSLAAGLHCVADYAVYRAAGTHTSRDFFFVEEVCPSSCCCCCCCAGVQLRTAMKSLDLLVLICSCCSLPAELR